MLVILIFLQLISNVEGQVKFLLTQFTSLRHYVETASISSQPPTTTITAPSERQENTIQMSKGNRAQTAQLVGDRR